MPTLKLNFDLSINDVLLFVIHRRRKGIKTNLSKPSVFSDGHLTDKDRNVTSSAKNYHFFLLVTVVPLIGGWIRLTDAIFFGDRKTGVLSLIVEVSQTHKKICILGIFLN